jgi:hypothetical protein
LNPTISAPLQYSEAVSLPMLTYGEAFLESLHQDTDAKYSYLILTVKQKIANCFTIGYHFLRF